MLHYQKNYKLIEINKIEAFGSTIADGQLQKGYTLKLRRYITMQIYCTINCFICTNKKKHKYVQVISKSTNANYVNEQTVKKISFEDLVKANY